MAGIEKIVDSSLIGGEDNSWRWTERGTEQNVAGRAWGFFTAENDATALAFVKQDGATDLTATGILGTANNMVNWGVNNGTANLTARAMFGASNEYARSAGSGNIVARATAWIGGAGRNTISSMDTFVPLVAVAEGVDGDQRVGAGGAMGNATPSGADFNITATAFSLLGVAENDVTRGVTGGNVTGTSTALIGAASNTLRRQGGTGAMQGDARSLLGYASNELDGGLGSGTLDGVAKSLVGAASNKLRRGHANAGANGSGLSKANARSLLGAASNEIDLGSRFATGEADADSASLIGAASNDIRRSGQASGKMKATAWSLLGAAWNTVDAGDGTGDADAKTFALIGAAWNKIDRGTGDGKIDAVAVGLIGAAWNNITRARSFNNTLVAVGGLAGVNYLGAGAGGGRNNLTAVSLLGAVNVLDRGDRGAEESTAVLVAVGGLAGVNVLSAGKGSAGRATNTLVGVSVLVGANVLVTGGGDETDTLVAVGALAANVAVVGHGNHVLTAVAVGLLAGNVAVAGDGNNTATLVAGALFGAGNVYVGGNGDSTVTMVVLAQFLAANVAVTGSGPLTATQVALAQFGAGNVLIGGDVGGTLTQVALAQFGAGNVMVIDNGGVTATQVALAQFAAGNVLVADNGDSILTQVAVAQYGAGNVMIVDDGDLTATQVALAQFGAANVLVGGDVEGSILTQVALAQYGGINALVVDDGDLTATQVALAQYAAGNVLVAGDGDSVLTQAALAQYGAANVSVAGDGDLTATQLAGAKYGALNVLVAGEGKHTVTQFAGAQTLSGSVAFVGDGNSVVTQVALAKAAALNAASTGDGDSVVTQVALARDRAGNFGRVGDGKNVMTQLAVTREKAVRNVFDGGTGFTVATAVGLTRDKAVNEMVAADSVGTSVFTAIAGGKQGATNLVGVGAGAHVVTGLALAYEGSGLNVAVTGQGENADTGRDVVTVIVTGRKTASGQPEAFGNLVATSGGDDVITAVALRPDLDAFRGLGAEFRNAGLQGVVRRIESVFAGSQNVIGAGDGNNVVTAVGGANAVLGGRGADVQVAVAAGSNVLVGGKVNRTGNDVAMALGVPLFKSDTGANVQVAYGKQNAIVGAMGTDVQVAVAKTANAMAGGDGANVMVGLVLGWRTPDDDKAGAGAALGNFVAGVEEKIAAARNALAERKRAIDDVANGTEHLLIKQYLKKLGLDLETAAEFARNTLTELQNSMARTTNMSLDEAVAAARDLRQSSGSPFAQLQAQLRDYIQKYREFAAAKDELTALTGSALLAELRSLDPFGNFMIGGADVDTMAGVNLTTLTDEQLGSLAAEGAKWFGAAANSMHGAGGANLMAGYGQVNLMTAGDRIKLRPYVWYPETYGLGETFGASTTTTALFEMEGGGDNVMLGIGRRMNQMAAGGGDDVMVGASDKLSWVRAGDGDNRVLNIAGEFGAIDLGNGDNQGLGASMKVNQVIAGDGANRLLGAGGTWNMMAAGNGDNTLVGFGGRYNIMMAVADSSGRVFEGQLGEGVPADFDGLFGRLADIGGRPAPQVGQGAPWWTRLAAGNSGDDTLIGVAGRTNLGFFGNGDNQGLLVGAVNAGIGGSGADSIYAAATALNVLWGGAGANQLRAVGPANVVVGGDVRFGAALVDALALGGALDFAAGEPAAPAAPAAMRAAWEALDWNALLAGLQGAERSVNDVSAAGAANLVVLANSDSRVRVTGDNVIVTSGGRNLIDANGATLILQNGGLNAVQGNAVRVRGGGEAEQMVLVGNDIAIDAGGGDDVVFVRGRGNRAQGGGGNDVLIAGGGALSAAVRARVDALVGAATAALGIGGANGASLDAILAAVGLDGLIGIARGLVEEARAALDGSREAQQMFAELLGEKLAAAAEESRSTAGEDAIARGEQRVNAPPGLPETTNGTTQSQQGIASANGAIGRAFGQAALPTVNFGELTSGQPATVQQARAGGEQMQADAIARKNEANREVNRAQGELNAQQDPVIDNFNFGEAVTGYNSELAQGRAQIANATSGSAIPGTLSPSVGNNEYATLAGRAGGAGGLNLSLGSGPVNNGDGLADGGWWNDGLPEDFALAPEAPDAPSAPTPDVSGANAQIGQAQAGGSNWQSSAASGASAGEDPLGIGSTIYAQAGEALTNRLRKNSQLGRLNSSDDLRTTGTQGSNLGQTQGMAGLGEGRELVGEGRGLLGELRDSSEGGGALEAGSPGIEAMVRERFATLTLDAVLGELRAKAGQVTEAAGQFLGASEADWSAVRGFLAEVSAGASSGEAARLEGGAGDDLLLGGAGGDDLAGDSGGDLLWGRGGDDRLSGGADADTYLFGRGDGSDVIATGDDNLDELRFGEAVSEFQVWLRQSGDDLQVRVGTWSGDTFRSVDQATVVGWYGGDEDAGGRPALPGFGIDGGASASGGASGGDAPLAQLRTDAGAVLLATQVQQLVDYMAGFTPDAAGSVNLTAEQHQQLDATISAAWQTA